jgi:sulfofructose kinase
MTAAPRVVCCGMAGLDRIMRVGAFHDGGGKLYSPDYEEVGGGPAATAAVAIARLGGEAALVARVGDDAAGRAILDELRGYDVDLSMVARLPRSRSPVSHVTIDDTGERQITHYRGAGLDVAPEWLHSSALDGAACVLADMGWWPGANHVLAMAREAGIPTVLDVDISADARSTALIAQVHHAVFSQAALALLSGTGDPRDGLRWAAANVLPSCHVGVTLGADGYLWLEEGHARHLPGHPVHAVDTLGAGDVFHGAFALGLAEGRSIAAAAALANAAAALKCARPSGRRGVPSRVEVDTLLAPNPVAQS